MEENWERGRLRRSQFEDKTVEERTRETDDSGPLGKTRMEHEQAKFPSLLDNREKMQKEAAVDGPPAVSIVQDISSLLTAVGHGKVSASGDGNEDESSSSSDSSFSSNASDEEHAADIAGGSTKSRLEAFCNGGQKRPAGGSCASAAGSAHSSVENTRGKPANARGVPVAATLVPKKAGASKKSGSARGAPGIDVGHVASQPLPETSAHESCSKDAPPQHLRESLEKEAKDVETKIPTVVTNFLQDEEKCVWDDPTSREATKKALADIKREAG